MSKKIKSSSQKVQDLIADAGGKIIGKTKLQKIAYLLEITGLGDGFCFDMPSYGPTSFELEEASTLAHLRKEIIMSEEVTYWGGYFTLYTTEKKSTCRNKTRKNLIQAAVNVKSVVLELAATAAYFVIDGYEDPWEEIRIRKPDKSAYNRLEQAKEFYEELRKISLNIPEIINYYKSCVICEKDILMSETFCHTCEIEIREIINNDITSNINKAIKLLKKRK